MMNLTIKQYEDSKYYISDTGEIFKKINPYMSNKGYLNVKLYLKDKTYTTGIHRLVAKLFLDNPNNCDQVNHKDENKLNNNVSNLEWCDNKYNSQYGTRIDRMAEGHCKPIIAIDSSGNIKSYPSTAYASSELNIDTSSITKALKNKRHSAGGYRWCYDNERN